MCGGAIHKILGLYRDYSKMEDYLSRMHCFLLRKTRATTNQPVLILSWLISGLESRTDDSCHYMQRIYALKVIHYVHICCSLILHRDNTNYKELTRNTATKY